MDGTLDDVHIQCADHEHRRRLRLSKDKGKIWLFLEAADLAIARQHESTDLNPVRQVWKSTSEGSV